MKPKSISIPAIAILAVAAGSLCIIGAVRAQEDTGIGSNPHLRAKSAPTQSAQSAQSIAVKLSDKDRKFIQDAANGGVAEVADGKLAEEDGQSAEVKKIGARMVADHSKANNDLMALAKEEGVTLPGAKSPGKWKSDKDYMDMMVKDHQADLAEFQKEAQSGTDPDVKAFAAKGAKMVSAHLKLAQETQGKLK